MIPRLRPNLGLADYTALFKSAPIEAFEARFATLMGQEHAIAFSYGRSGLLFLLKALGLQNQEVICPAYSCVVVAHAIVLSDNRPVFIDSDMGGFNMDLEQAERAIKNGAKVIIATSIHGYPVDLDKLDALQKRYPDVIIIQDCAHSFAAQWQGRPVQQAGRAAIFGLNISKLMTSIFGGMVTTDDAALAQSLRALRDLEQKPVGYLKNWQRRAYLIAASTALHPLCFEWVCRIQKWGWIDRFTQYYDETLIDMPVDYTSAMASVEAAVGMAQCDRYPELIDHRRRIAHLYECELQDVDGLELPPIIDGATFSHYVPQVSEPDALLEKMAAKGIELGRLIDYCIPDMEAYAPYRSVDFDYPVTRALNQRVINLPLHVDERLAQRIALDLRQTLQT